MNIAIHTLLLTMGLLTLAAVHAHSPAAHQNHHAPSTAPAEQKDWGIAGDPNKVQRTIEIRMTDDMRFAPKDIQVKLGETVRLVAVNAGKTLHEIVIGTPQELKAHAEMMKKHPGMEHDEPYMAHVDPGKKGTIVWTFNRTGRFEFACLIPGHFEAGMIGRITVK
ncbi:plastocyanin/azurin family copper-binding protein [Limnohabitans sp. DCL3]|uniref:cupredoxin domain-containing protein n=1 Tax=Limnohabitans sp. DCL3 TaxID=3374103 RepID=UPI003A869A6E